jgi:hypothetical protein
MTRKYIHIMRSEDGKITHPKLRINGLPDDSKLPKMIFFSKDSYVDIKKL